MKKIDKRDKRNGEEKKGDKKHTQHTLEQHRVYEEREKASVLRNT